MIIVEEILVGGRKLQRLYSNDESKQIYDKVKHIIDDEVIGTKLDINNYEEIDRIVDE